MIEDLEFRLKANGRFNKTKRWRSWEEEWFFQGFTYLFEREYKLQEWQREWEKQAPH